MASLFISAAHKSSGKTTISIGLNAAFRKRGLNVQPFKKGPDYIDPIWHAMAAGNPCYNLDFFTASEEETISEFIARSQSADLSVIEGNKGLYDGLNLDGSNSNAALAKAVGAPVILVIDVRGTMRGIAPLLIGYKAFDPEINIAGVIASMSGGERHESKLRAAVEYYTDIPYLGALRRQPSIALNEQHLGLMPGYEDPNAEKKIEAISQAVSDQIDLDQIFSIAQTANQPVAPIIPFPSNRKNIFSGLKIGIAQDRAFGFYYPGDLEAIRDLGATILPINTLADSCLPEIDGLFIGGGFPEHHAAALEGNRLLRQAIKSAIELGMPTYVECGGLMYLSKQLCWQGRIYDMVGAIPGNAIMYKKPCGRGYVKLEEIPRHSLWPQLSEISNTIPAHEFHYSSIQGLPGTLTYSYKVTRGTGITQNKDGLIYKNLLASYSHLRNTSKNPWVKRFLTFTNDYKLSHHKVSAKQVL